MEILCQQSQIIKKQEQNITHSNQWKHNTKDPRTWSNKNLVVSSEISSFSLQEIYSVKIVEILILQIENLYIK